MHSMRFDDVDGEQAREIVEAIESDSVRVKSINFSPNPSMDGKGFIIVVYEEVPKPKKRNWLRWIFRRGI